MQVTTGGEALLPRPGMMVETETVTDTMGGTAMTEIGEAVGDSPAMNLSETEMEEVVVGMEVSPEMVGEMEVGMEDSPEMGIEDTPGKAAGKGKLPKKDPS